MRAEDLTDERDIINWSIPSGKFFYPAGHSQMEKDILHIERWRRQHEDKSLLEKKVKNNLQYSLCQCHLDNSLVFQHSPEKQLLLLFCS